MLGQALLAGLETALNRALALDTTALPRLAALAGKVIEVDCTTPALRLYLLPQSDGLRLAGHWEATPDCILQAPASTLLQLAVSRDKSAILHRPELSILGEAGVLHQLSAILDDLELDWEYEISRHLGPVPAHLFGSALRHGQRWSGQSLDSLRLDLADYLAEEARLLVGREEAEARFAEIDELREALDRLQARIDRLTSRKGTA